jgi:hypothetical protein
MFTGFGIRKAGLFSSDLRRTRSFSLLFWKSGSVFEKGDHS